MVPGFQVPSDVKKQKKKPREEVSHRRLACHQNPIRHTSNTRKEMEGRGCYLGGRMSFPNTGPSTVEGAKQGLGKPLPECFSIVLSMIDLPLHKDGEVSLRLKPYGHKAIFIIVPREKKLLTSGL